MGNLQKVGGPPSLHAFQWPLAWFCRSAGEAERFKAVVQNQHFRNMRTLPGGASLELRFLTHAD